MECKWRTRRKRIEMEMMKCNLSLCVREKSMSVEEGWFGGFSEEGEWNNRDKKRILKDL